MRIALYVLAAAEVFSALFTIGMIGKPRKATTPGAAIAAVVIAAAFVLVLVRAAQELK